MDRSYEHVSWLYSPEPEPEAATEEVAAASATTTVTHRHYHYHYHHHYNHNSPPPPHTNPRAPQPPQQPRHFRSDTSRHTTQHEWTNQRFDRGQPSQRRNRRESSPRLQREISPDSPPQRRREQRRSPSPRRTNAGIPTPSSASPPPAIRRHSPSTRPRTTKESIEKENTTKGNRPITPTPSPVVTPTRRQSRSSRNRQRQRDASSSAESARLKLVNDLARVRLQSPENSRERHGPNRNATAHGVLHSDRVSFLRLPFGNARNALERFQHTTRSDLTQRANVKKLFLLSILLLREGNGEVSPETAWQLIILRLTTLAGLYSNHAEVSAAWNFAFHGASVELFDLLITDEIDLVYEHVTRLLADN